MILPLNCTGELVLLKPRALGISLMGVVTVFLVLWLSFIPPHTPWEQDQALGNYLITGVEPWDSAVGVVNPLLANHRDPLAPDPRF